MFRFLTRALLLAVGTLALTATDARADLFIRASATGAATQTFNGPVFDPQPGLSSQTQAFNIGNFSLVVATNVSTSTSGSTSQDLNVTVSYAGPTGVGSDMLTIEFLGTNYVLPPGGSFVVNGSSGASNGGNLLANSVVLTSGVSLTNAGLPGTVGSTAGLTGVTSNTGGMTPAASTFIPTQATSAPYTLSNKYSFYQVLNFSGFTTNGTAGVTANAVISAVVPEPATITCAVVGLVGIGLTQLRRRKSTAVTA